MTIPDPIQLLLSEVLLDVQSHPEHEMSPLRRREIYSALESIGDGSVIGWLSVITAKKILPMFKQRYPDDDMPQELLETAIAVLEGVVDPRDTADKMDRGYYASSVAWGYDEREIPWPVWLAGNACYFALKEVCGQSPLSYLPEYYKGDVLTSWTDVDLSEMDFCDTAAAAALASSSDERGTAYESNRLLTFWKWWLGEAIPSALESAYR